MQNFAVADLNVRGELLALEHYAYQHLERIPGAADLIAVFSALLWRSPEQFEATVPDAGGIAVRWVGSSPTSGILTIRSGFELASLSLLASGISPDADRVTLEAFQRHLLRELRDTATEPAFALLDLHERPLVATINFLSPPDERHRMLVALADRCFAAAWFRYLHLA